MKMFENDWVEFLQENTSEIIQPYVPELKTKCNLSNDIYDYVTKQKSDNIDLHTFKKLSKCW